MKLSTLLRKVKMLLSGRASVLLGGKSLVRVSAPRAMEPVHPPDRQVLTELDTLVLTPRCLGPEGSKPPWNRKAERSALLV